MWHKRCLKVGGAIMYKIITTVGTSVIANYGNKDVRKMEGYKPINPVDLEKLDHISPEAVLYGNNQIAKQIQNLLRKAWIKGLDKDEDGNWNKIGGYNENCCAEIKTILEFYKDRKQEKNFKLEVYLIITDTARSALAAKLIKENINHFNSNIVVKDILIIKGLQTDDYEKFENEGINNLFKVLKKTIEKDKKEKGQFNEDKIIINISGGYKAVIPYMTIFAQVYNIKSVYIYEDSTSLITIPALPIQIDWGFAEEYYPYLSDSILIRDKDKQAYLQQKGLLKYKDGNYLWTSLGRFFKDVIEKELHVSKSVMGYFFEYKLYEYYVENIYKERYGIVRHSKIIYQDKNEPYKDVEIDLILSADNEMKDYVVIEVKSLFVLRETEEMQGFSKLKKQLEKHVKTMGRLNKYPKEYHLCMYTPNESKFRKLVDSEIKNIMEASKIFEKTPVRFKTFIIKAKYKQMCDRGMRNSNPYQQLMKDKLEYGKNFKEINY